jgi:hypothetical protein
MKLHEQPFPLHHYYSIHDAIRDASDAQRGFRSCPTARDIKQSETNCINLSSSPQTLKYKTFLRKTTALVK